MNLRKINPTLEQIADLKANWKTTSRINFAKKFKVSPTTISTWGIELGLRPPREAKQESRNGFFEHDKNLATI